MGFLVKFLLLLANYFDAFLRLSNCVRFDLEIMNQFLSDLFWDHTHSLSPYQCAH